MYGIFETQEELFKALEELGKEARKKAYDDRMTQEELLKSGAIDETAKHEGEGTIIVGVGKRKRGDKD